MIDHADVVAAMNKKYGNLYVQDVIPKDTYKGMDADNHQATVMNILVAHESMDDKTAYNIVKTIFDRKDDIVAVHKEALNFKLENQKAAPRRSRSTPARSSTSPKRASRSTERRRVRRRRRAGRPSATRRCSGPSSTSRRRRAPPTS